MDITNFININSNNLINEMNYKDIEELLRLLKEYKISFRDILNMDLSTFGIEIEYIGDFDKIDSLIKSINYSWLLSKRLNCIFYKHEKDASIPDGGEVISPILKNEVDTWKQIKEICELLKQNECSSSYNTGAHIHYGTQILDNNINNWFKFLKLFAAYENIIFRFGYGEYEAERPYIYSHASSIGTNFLNTYNKYSNENITISKMIKAIKFKYKYDAIKINNIINNASFKKNRTIEFRNPNGTIEPVIWQNNINLFYHLLKYSTSDDYNDDIIDKRISINNKIIGNIKYYNEIDTNGAIELSDLIFNNNLDKINFLRQYFKNFVEVNKFIKTKDFIKR